MNSRNIRSLSDGGNYVSEWFGHRMYPTVVATDASLKEQRAEHCPFLSLATGESRQCIKAEASRGVCTISSASNGIRQDWVVCPYRAFDRGLMQEVAGRFFGGAGFHMLPAPSLSVAENQERVLARLADDERVLVYFDQKMGGEIGVAATPASPEIAFDTTFVELTRGVDDSIEIGRFAVMEIQTMDFHGSYQHAVRDLRDALRLHREQFPKQVQENQNWLGKRIEGPNIANVFKRTFWQMMFKFEMAGSPGCAGVALTLPRAVWDSWERFLGAPELVDTGDGTFALPGQDKTDAATACWIYVFDFDAAAAVTPSPMRVHRVIRTTASALAHHALEKAPRGAIRQLEGSIYPKLQERLRKFWPYSFTFRGHMSEQGGVIITEDRRPIEQIIAEDGG